MEDNAKSTTSREDKYAAERKIYAQKVKDVMSMKDRYDSALNTALILNEMMRVRNDGRDPLKDAIDEHVKAATHYSERDVDVATDVSTYDMACEN